MKKHFSLTRLAVLGVGLLAAGVLSFTLGGGSTSARGDWNRDNNEMKYYLTLDGVTGEIYNDQLQGAIELSSYRFLESEPEVQPMSAAAEDVNFGDNNLRFQADASKASPMLFSKAAAGEQMSSGKLTVSKGWDHDYMTFDMTNLYVTSYQNSSNHENPLMDEVVLSFEALEVAHNEDNHDSFKRGWNFKDKKLF